MKTSKSTQTFNVSEAAELMSFLIAKMPHQSRTNIKSLLRDGQIYVEGKVVTQFNHPLTSGQKVEISSVKASKLPVRTTGVRILFEDAYLLIVEKEAGLLSIATDKGNEPTAYRILSEHVKRQDPKNKIFIVHRLDRDTSGVMVFAKSEDIKNKLQSSWGPDTKERTYVALVERKPTAAEGTIRSYLQESKATIVYSSQQPERGQLAITHYETLRSNAHFSLLKVALETGRKNQIRVHMQDIGHPVVGDKKYGATQNPIQRLGLHAWVLGFAHPITQNYLRYESKIPPKFLGVFEKR